MNEPKNTENNHDGAVRSSDLLGGCIIEHQPGVWLEVPSSRWRILLHRIALLLRMHLLLLPLAYLFRSRLHYRIAVAHDGSVPRISAVLSQFVLWLAVFGTQ
jgi:hypothetical protein